jgi:hypothetical protein
MSISVIGQLTDHFEFPVIPKLSGQSHPKTPEFLERVIKRLACLVGTINVTDLMLIGEKKFCLLQTSRISVFIKFAEIFQFFAKFIT